MKNRRRKGHLGQVVALADILANGVVILMMLIVLSIKIQSDRAQEEINQNADITTILSRDMAKSIIFNDLPSSPPAVLHDYSSCAVAHDCNESLYPILEVYDDYVRMKNENVRMSLRELLNRPNPMDIWLSSFSVLEKSNIRMDIYGVGMYYLALSILGENGIAHPRHWHFLQLPKTGKGDGDLSAQDFIAKYQDDSALSLEGGLGLGEQGEADKELEESGEDGDFSAKSFDDLTMIEGASFSQLGQKGLLPQQGEFSEESSESREESEVDIKSRLKSGSFSNVGIRIPNMRQDIKMGEGEAGGELTRRELMVFIALLYLHYGAELEGLQVQYLQNTLQAMIERPRHIPRNSNFPPTVQLLEKLDEILAEDLSWPEYFEYEQAQTIDQVGLVGRPLDFISLFRYRGLQTKELETKRVSIVLRPWPSAYQGERAEVTDSIVLVHPRQLELVDEQLRWLPVAFLTPVADTVNINLGFVLAQLKGGELFIPGEVNQIWTSSGPILAERIDPNAEPVALRLFYIYVPLIVLGFLSLLGIFVRIYRRRTPATA